MHIHITVLTTIGARMCVHSLPPPCGLDALDLEPNLVILIAELFDEKRS